MLYDGFAFRIDRVLKSGDISWRCTVKNCNGRIKTDQHSSAIINGNCNHTHESDSRKIQKQIIRAVVKRKAAFDITTRPIKLVRCELLSIEDECLQENDLKRLTMSIYEIDSDENNTQRYQKQEKKFTIPCIIKDIY